MRYHVSKRLQLISVGAMLTTGIAMMAPVPAPAAASRQQQPSNTADRPVTVDLDDLEKDPDKFIGKSVTVEGEVDRVLGPNLFTIDERNWVDLQREMPVVVPDPFAAIVQSDAPVRITGTVQKVPIAEIEKRGGVLTDTRIRTEIETRPAILATEVSSIAPAAVAVNLLVRPDVPVGTSGRSGETPVTDVNQLARSTNKSLVGRRVNLRDVKVAVAGDRGFWITAPDGERIFVIPADKTSAQPGQAATIQGVVLELPEGLRVELNASGEPIYIYAERVAAR